jgi:hypothetical protein
MGNIKRYWCTCEDGKWESYGAPFMELDNDGDYVKYKDHKSELKKANERIAELDGRKKLLSELHLEYENRQEDGKNKTTMFLQNQTSQLSEKLNEVIRYINKTEYNGSSDFINEIIKDIESEMFNDVGTADIDAPFKKCIEIINRHTKQDT